MALAFSQSFTVIFALIREGMQRKKLRKKVRGQIACLLIQLT